MWLVISMAVFVGMFFGLVVVKIKRMMWDE